MHKIYYRILSFSRPVVLNDRIKIHEDVQPLNFFHILQEFLDSVSAEFLCFQQLQEWAFSGMPTFSQMCTDVIIFPPVSIRKCFPVGMTWIVKLFPQPIKDRLA